MVEEGNMAEVNVGDEFEPGDVVPKSGIYRVIHDRHAQPHEVTCIYGKVFPPCYGCGHHLRYRLVTASQHSETHELLKESVGSA
jgi:hypothetical protein